MLCHIADHGDTRKCRWIAKLCANGLHPVVEILEINPVDWQHAERKWIAHFRALDADLCNHTDGGEGLHNPTIETRAKMSLIRQTEWNENREKYLTVARSPERCARLSVALTGREAPWVKDLPQNQRGRKVTPELAVKLTAILRENPPKNHHIPTEVERESSRLRMLGNQHTSGRVMPEHEKVTRSNANLGKKRSPETCLKQREAALRRWAKSDAEARRLHTAPALIARLEKSDG
jgi:hypothetical protein